MDKKIANYNVITAPRLADLVAAVSAATQKGAWQPFGNMVIAAADPNDKHSNLIFYQPMVRYTHEAKADLYKRFGGEE